MKQKQSSRRRRSSTKSVLRLPDLEHAKAASTQQTQSGVIVTPSMSSLTGIARNRAWPSTGSWSCVIVLISNPRQLAPGTINLRLGAVRRLAYEAADCGLLSADLAAGIRRVKGVKKLGMRLGNWLTAEQGHALWQAPDHQRLKGKRDRALLALLLACGLRRHEAVALRLDHLQQREEQRHCSAEPSCPFCCP